MLKSIKRHALAFIVSAFFIALITVLSIVVDYRTLGYIAFNGSFLMPVGLFAWLIIAIHEDDKHNKKGDK